MDDNSLQRLINEPIERLNVELKRWIDPKSDLGKEKIAKGCLALYNNDGGCMLVGICDDGSPDADSVPSDVRTTFHVDVIQAIISKYSFTPIAIEVAYPNRDGQEYPVIIVPGGVETPAVTKSSVGKITPDEVYVRSISSNGTVSSSKPTRRDWDRLIRICMGNREADIANFFRRHLGLSVDLDALRESFSLPKSLEKRVLDLLDDGAARFEQANRSRKVPSVGFVEIAFEFEGKADISFEANQQFLHKIQNYRVDYSGWPPFVYIYSGNADDWNPYHKDSAWEANIFSPGFGMGPPAIDFWRIDPSGRFYTKRALQADMGVENVEPCTVLDPILQTRRITEAIVTALEFADAMEYTLAQTQIAFAMRWTKLSGRRLVPWASPGRLLRAAPKCVDDTAIESVLIPADTPKSALSQYVEKIAFGLLRRFAGYDSINSEVVKSIVDNTMNRHF
ncbi:AlbA family DNA-binding domain-containing protein [Roseiconus lacunae]|uniref:AlbA family DNA-binding domain-containing protein n=1 Tax=Roseiconus lacunae TaxID=2605694 RepID=UPI001E2EC8E7|nr:RNA-binding domain-containing protein [Roseiconus lacunae]MCD0458622.1 putative DNA binding domain-containing protein [Roseiconus lacunae]